MEALIMERLSKEEIIQIKGGEWVVIDGDWYWIEDYRLKDKD